MSNLKLQGVYTAIVTPFQDDGSMDEAAFERLLDRQIEAGVDGIVPVGTTGESATLDVDEHSRVIDLTIQRCKGRVAVIAGTGANATEEAVRLTRHALEAGADATLQVTPYYNKPSQKGLVAHFSAVADVGLPVVLYNVPGRSGCEIAIESIAALASHPNVIAVKEAGGCAKRVTQILDVCDLTVLSGDDELTLPMMAGGARGCISVASNVLPAAVSEMVHAVLKGDWSAGVARHHQLYPLFRDLFIETNPIPVKAALAMMGWIREIYRLPLVSLDAQDRETLRATLQAVGAFESGQIAKGTVSP